MKRNTRAGKLVRTAVFRACRSHEAALRYALSGKKRSESLADTAGTLYAGALVCAEEPREDRRRRVDYRVLSDIAEALLYIARFESGDPKFSTDFDAIDAAFEEAAGTVKDVGRFVYARIDLPGGTCLEREVRGVRVTVGGVETLHLAGIVYDAAKTVLDFVSRK